jgi:hypothetical protein
MMKVLRWMFTMEGAAATPGLSAGIGAVIVGVIAGIYFALRNSDGWGIAAGVLMAVVFFASLYPRLREEHDRQVTSSAAVQPALRDRITSARPSLIRLTVLFLALPVGVVLSVAFDSVRGLAVALAAVLVAVVVMRGIAHRER